MTPAQNRSIMLHVGTFVSGVFAAISVMASQNIDLYAAYNHAVTGVRELMAAWAIIVPALTVGYAAFKASTRQKLLDVVADPAAPSEARDITPTPNAIKVAEELKKAK